MDVVSLCDSRVEKFGLFHIKRPVLTQPLTTLVLCHLHLKTTYSTPLTTTQCPGKNGPPKQNAVKCTVYNTIQ